MHFSLIIFDYDGVLVDSLDAAVSIGGEFCRSVSHSPAPTRETIGSLERMTYPEIARAIRLPPEHAAGFASHMFDRFLAIGRSMPFFPGIEALLRRVSSRDIAIVSGNARRVITEKLAAHGLADKIGCVLGAHEPGDKAEKIRAACRHFGADAGSSCMVGDSASDIVSAKRAGVRSIAVTWGWQSRDTLARENPDFIADSVRELRGLLV